jgi:tetratricopeptide (TPR) repeat protein
MQMAYEHYFFRDFRESLLYNLEALKAGNPDAFHDYFSTLDIMNTTGLCYQHLNMLDSAEYYFRQTILLARANNKIPWEGIASGNLGNNYFLRGNYDQSVPLLQKDVAIAVDTKDWGLASGSLMILADISFIRNDISNAEKYLSAAQDYVYRSGQYERLQKLYPVIIKAQCAPGATCQSRHVHRLRFIGKRQYKQETQRTADATRKTGSSAGAIPCGSRSNEKPEKDQHARKKYPHLRSSAMMMIAAVLVYRRQRSKSARQQDQIEKGRQELADAAKQLEEFARNISEKNSLTGNAATERQWRRDYHYPVTAKHYSHRCRLGIFPPSLRKSAYGILITPKRKDPGPHPGRNKVYRPQQTRSFRKRNGGDARHRHRCYPPVPQPPQEKTASRRRAWPCRNGGSGITHCFRPFTFLSHPLSRHSHAWNL